MTQLIFEIGIGVMWAAVMLLVAVKTVWPWRFLALSLVIAALIYVLFPLLFGGSSTWVLIELAGLLLYGSFALLGLRHSPLWIAVGWGLHVLWDLVLHSSGPGSEFVPAWYPGVCLGVDLTLAAGIVLLRKYAQKVSVQ